MHSTLVKLSQQYGPISALDMPGRSLVCVADPGAIKQVLKRPAHYGRSSFFKRAFGYVADGLLVLEGSQWQAHRRLLQPVFHARNLTGVVSATNSACDALFSGWARLFPDGKRIPVHTMWPLMSMDVIGKVGFGLDFNCVQTSLAGGDAVSVAPTEMMEAVEALFRGVEVRISLPRFLWRFRKDAAAFDHARSHVRDFLSGVLRNARGGDATQDCTITKDTTLLSLMLKADNETATAMCDQEIVDEMLMFFLAGHETTANSLSWITMLLCKHPAVLRKMVEEVQTVVGPEGTPPTVDHLKHLRYTTSVFVEALRLFPVAPFTVREAKEDSTLCGRRIPAKTVVFLNFWAVHQDENLYPDAQTFNPDRWMPDPAAKLSERKFEYFAFSVGPQSCIGKHFAHMEMQVALARLAQWLAARRGGTGDLHTPLMSLSQQQAHGHCDGAGDPATHSVATITAKPDGGVFIDIRA